MLVRLGSVLRMGAALAGALGTLTVVTPARAYNTTLSIKFNAAAYTIVATGTVPAQSVPAAEGSGSSDTSQPSSVPAVGPGQPLTVSVLVNSDHTVNEGTIAIQIDATTVATVNVTPQMVITPAAIPSRIVGGVLQPSGPVRPMTTATVGGGSATFLVPAGSHDITVRYSGGIHFSSNIFAKSITSIPHTAIDLQCGCQAGTTAFACLVAGQPKSPPSERLVCRSNVYAETVSANAAAPFWGVGPDGIVSFNITGIGILSARTTGVGTGAVSATGSTGAPTSAGAYPIASSFQPANGVQGTTATGPSTSVQVTWP
jgi:hypothetical protein